MSKPSAWNVMCPDPLLAPDELSSDNSGYVFYIGYCWTWRTNMMFASCSGAFNLELLSLYFFIPLSFPFDCAVHSLEGTTRITKMLFYIHKSHRCLHYQREITRDICQVLWIFSHLLTLLVITQQCWTWSQSLTCHVTALMLVELQQLNNQGNLHHFGAVCVQSISSWGRAFSFSM